MLNMDLYKLCLNKVRFELIIIFHDDSFDAYPGLIIPGINLER